MAQCLLDDLEDISILAQLHVTTMPFEQPALEGHVSDTLRTVRIGLD